ncbi:MAG: hypothetical protein WBE88_14825, partial [Candidatus Acidiferrales bacterium]
VDGDGVVVCLVERWEGAAKLGVEADGADYAFGSSGGENHLIHDGFGGPRGGPAANEEAGSVDMAVDVGMVGDAEGYG